MKARSHQPAPVVRAWRMGSTAEFSTQACSAMFRRRVTRGNQVAMGRSHSTKKAHHAPASVAASRRPAFTARNGRAERAVTRAPSGAPASGRPRKGAMRWRKKVWPVRSRMILRRSEARVTGKGADSTRSGSSACWAYLWWARW